MVELPEIRAHVQACSWGPSQNCLPQKFIDLPYQPFKKQDTVGKVSDWTGATYGDSRRTRIYNSSMGLQGSDNIFAAQGEDDNGFALVDNNKVVRPIYHRGRGGRGGYNNRGGYQNQRGRGFQNNNRGRRGNFRGRYGYRPWQRQQNREPSVKIESHWEKMDTLDFSSLAKMTSRAVSEGADLYTCGSVRRYDKRYDKVSLRRMQRVNPKLSENVAFSNESTLEDKVIRDVVAAKGNFKGTQIIATDSIVSALMCATRSVIPWDIHCYKYGGKEKGSFQILLDIEDREMPSPIDIISVAETATEPLPEEGVDEINKPLKRTEEATIINRTISQQVLFNNSDTNPVHKAKNEYPFDLERQMRPPSRIYKYRSFKLGTEKEPPCELIVRTEVDAYEGQPKTPKMVSVKTLNEWNSKYCNGVNWRDTLEKQTSTVLATEIKNNSFKVSRWIMQAVLAGIDTVKLAFVTREKVTDNQSHLLVNMESLTPEELATQAGLNIDNCWGVFRSIINSLKDRPEGQYYIIRNPNEKELNLYRVPDDSGSEEEESGEESEDGSGEDGESDSGESGEESSGESNESGSSDETSDDDKE